MDQYFGTVRNSYENGPELTLMYSPNLVPIDHIAISHDQQEMAHSIYQHGIRILHAVINPAADLEDRIIDDLNVALAGLWPDYYDKTKHIWVYEQCWYMLPTVTSENFNLIAWSILKQLKLLSIKYPFQKLFERNTRELDNDLERLQAWHLRVIAKREELVLVMEGIPMEEGVWRAILNILTEDIPLYI
jgi:hypothetical protein